MSAAPAPPQAADRSHTRPTRRLVRSAGLIGAATMTSRVLGLVRDQLLAFYFGAGNAVDAYNVAFRIPNLVRDLFAEGAMSAAFVPTFTRTLTRDGRAAAWRHGNNVINALLVVSTAIVVLGIVFARPLVVAFAGQYAAVPGKLELTVTLTRVILPFLVLVALAAAVMGMLNSLHRFFIPALSPAMFNIASIVCIVGLTGVLPRFGWPPIMSMAIGVLVGGLGQLALQWPVLRKEGYRYKPVLDLKDPGLRQTLVLMGPGTLGLAATQVNVFVNTVLATTQGTGAVSWLNYAFRLMYLPLGIFGASIATAAIPTISRHAARHDVAALRHEVANGLGMMLLLNVPATVGLLVLAHPIVALLFERGAFGPDDTQATAYALMWYAAGLSGYSVVKIASPVFYALQDGRTPVLVSVGCVLINTVLNLVLVRWFGYVGLAGGTSLAALVNAAVLLAILRRRLGGIEASRLVSLLLRVALASVAMGAVVAVAASALEYVAPGRGLAVRALRVLAPILAGLVALVGASRLLQLTEMRDVLHGAWAMVTGRGDGAEQAAAADDSIH